MSQTTYSNDEIKHLLQTLYDEKKKNKELLIKLQQNEAKTPDITQKNRAADSTQKLEEEKEELVSENRALQLQVASLKKQIEKLKSDAAKQDPRQIELFNEALERQNALEHQLREKTEELATLKAAEQPISEATPEEIKNLQELVALLQEQLGKSQEESALLKESFSKNVREAKEVTGLYQTANKERSDALLKVHHYLGQIETQRQEIGRLHGSVLREREQNEALHKELNSLKNKAIKAEALESDLIQERQRIDALDAELALERHMRRDVEEELDQAQNHLAKKLKETALLEQSNEETKHSWIEAQKIITENKMKLGELQTSIELYRQQEARLQEQLQEASKAAETQMAKAEEKHFNLSQKLQSVENRLKELEKIEEKQNRLQSLLSDISGLFSSEAPADQGVLPVPEPSKPTIHEDKERHFTDLFQMPKQPQKHRRNLLD